MKKYSLFPLAIVIVISSCQKTMTHSAPPTGIDTTKLEKVDTSYLKKTATYYSYDATGTYLTDSVLISYTYDSKLRPLVTVTFRPGTAAIDSTFDSYDANQQVIRSVTYANQVKTFDITRTYFLNTSGNPDSVITSTYNFGSGTPGPQYSFYYYHYNKNNQDTLENGYTIDNSIQGQFIKLRKTYKAGLLDSSLFYYGDTTQVSDIKLFADGNLLSDMYYSNGSYWRTVTFTHYTVISGGFYGLGGDRQLLRSITYLYPASPINNKIENITYTLDSRNRVKILDRTLNRVNTQKEVYTYY